MTIRVVALPNPFEPHNRIERDAPPGLSIWGIVRMVELDDGGPTIVAVNGVWILRKDWDDAVPDGAHVEVKRLVAGGGGQGKAIGTNIAMIVAGIAVLVASAYTGGSFAAAGYGLIAGGVAGLIGTALISKPSVPSTLLQEGASASPAYSVSAGNRRRIGEPIPAVYGRHRLVPDLVAEVWWEYIDDQQHVYLVLCLGHGEFDFDPATDISLSDAALASFTDGAGVTVIAPGDADPKTDPVTVQVVPPGASLTSFPDLVTTSAVVQGQALAAGAPGDWVGPFPCNPVGTDCQKIGIDILMPKGLSDAGASVTVRWEVEARAITAAGLPADDFGFVHLSSEEITANTVSPIRRSYTYVRPYAWGRWEVRVRRTTAGGSTTTRVDDLTWGSLRGFLPPVIRYPKVRPGETDPRFPLTMLAIRVRATEQVSGDVVQRLSVVATRKLPVWDGSTWSAPVATRNPAWAFADMARNQVYGAGLPDGRLDLDALLALAATWDTRRDSFDAVLDQAITTWDALTKAARAGRATPVLVGGMLTCVRDQPRETYAAVFTPATIIAGSLSIVYRFRQADDPDGILASYIDPETWQPSHVWASVDGVEPERPASVDLFGVTSQAQAQREADHLARIDAYQRRTVTWSTEMDGFLPQLGDKVAISHDVPGWGQSGVVLDVSTLRLTVSEPLTWTVGVDHYIGLRQPDGTLAGPFLVTPVAGHADQLDLATSPGFTLRPDLSIGERTAFLFGPGVAWRADLIITSIVPKDEHTVELTGVPYDARIYFTRRAVVMPVGSPDFAPGAPDHAGYVAGTDGRMSDGSEPYRVSST